MSSTNVIETADNRGYMLRRMNRPLTEQHAGIVVKTARKARGWSQAKLAEEVGISQPAIKKIEAGDTTKSKHLPKVAEVLNIDLRKLDPTLSRSVNQRQGNPDITEPAPVSPIPGGALIGAKDLPVYALAQGGRGATILSTDPVEWVSRPQPLDRVKDGYGIIVSEDSMSPEFESGDIALVHPHRPPMAGRTCVFYSEKPDGTVICCIKRLRRETAEAWLVTQFNPPRGQRRDFELKKSEWQKCHLTVGSYKGR